MARMTKAQKAAQTLLIGLFKDLAAFLHSEADNIAHTAEYPHMSVGTLLLCLNNSIRKVRAELDKFESEAKKLPLV